MHRIASATLFPTEAPLAPDEMIGRGADVQELVAQLSNGVHRIVTAPRRTGKSSVCRAAVAALRDRGLYSASISLFVLTDSAALTRGLAQEALANRSALHKLIQRSRDAAQFVLRGAGLTLVLKVKGELGEAVELAFDRAAGARLSPVEAFAAALELPQRIAERDDRRFVLFIDEMQELAAPRASYGEVDALLGAMREVLHDSPRVTCLFAGSIEHLMREIFTSARRPMAGFGGFHELEPIGEGEWHTGLTRRFERDGCTVSEDALARIFVAGEGHPRSTMLIAQQTHVAAVEEGVHAIGATLAERGYRAAMQAEQTRHVDLVDRIRALGAVALRVSRRLAAGEAPYGAAEAKAVKRALDALALAGVASRRGRNGWYVSDPLLARYVRENLLG